MNRSQSLHLLTRYKHHSTGFISLWIEILNDGQHRQNVILSFSPKFFLLIVNCLLCSMIVWPKSHLLWVWLFPLRALRCPRMSLCISKSNRRTVNVATSSWRYNKLTRVQFSRETKVLDKKRVYWEKQNVHLINIINDSTTPRLHNSIPFDDSEELTSNSLVISCSWRSS